MNKKILNTIGIILIILATLLTIELIGKMTQSILPYIDFAISTTTISFLIAFALQPLSILLQKKIKLKEDKSIMLANFLFFGTLLSVVVLFIPIVQTISFLVIDTNFINSWVEEAKNNKFFALANKYAGENITGQINQIILSVFQFITNSITNFFGIVINSLVRILFVIVLTIYMSFEMKNILNYFKYLSSKNEKAKNTVESIILRIHAYYKSIPKYMFFDFLLMAFAYVIVLKIDPNIGFGLAALIAIINVIPYVGGFLSFILLILISAPQGFNQVLIAIGVNSIVTLVEGNILAPKFYSNVSNFSPLLLLIVFILITPIIGFWGLIYGTPITIIIDQLGKDYIFSKFIKEQKKDEK